MELAPGLYAFPWTQPQTNNCNAFFINAAPPTLIDPGHSQLFGHVGTGMAQDGLKDKPELVIVTHCHPDHIEAALSLQKQGVKLAMHPTEDEYLRGEGRRMAAAMGVNMPEVVTDVFLSEGKLKLGDEELEVYHTPGHSPGHICLYWPKHKALFAGDLIFAQGVGRVDFPGGDGNALKESILRMAGLDLEWVLTGHGPIIKGAENIKRNFDYIQQAYFGML